MKKLALTLSTALLMFANTAFAEIAMGVTANFASIDTDGSETLRDSAKVTTGGASENVVVPEIFVEVTGDAGALGVAYIPTQELGSKSRTDTAVRQQDGGTYKAEAEVDSHIMVYADINMTEYAGQTVYAKLGLANATIKTLESLNSGSTYQDQDVMGYTVGLGFRGDISDYFYKVEGTFTDYEDYEDTSSAGNKVTAETEIISLKASVGMAF